ncbi:MAG: hypothetical protein R6U85_11930 [Salinivirgaceae bacterium]
MLEHQITIINALRNEKELLLKEVKKSIRWLTPEELEQLKTWLRNKFPEFYLTELKYHFEHASV